MKTNIKQSLMALLIAAIGVSPAYAAGEPGNVKNVVVKAKDATTLTVSWDAVKDAEGNDPEHYHIYYGPASVQDKASEVGQYEAEVDTPTNATTYDLTNLKANTPYYIAVTAVDKNDVESEQYSIEATGTPSSNPTAQTTGTTGDSLAPTVVNVIAADKNHILVGFSEKVILPSLLPETAFMVTEQNDKDKMLEVVSAEVFAEDAAGKTVLLETANQTATTSYMVTVGAAVKDAAENPMEAGNSDSGMFVGSNKASSGAITTRPAATETKAPTAEELLLDTTTPTSTGNATTNNTTTPTSDPTTTPKPTTTTTPATTGTTTTSQDKIAPEDVRNLALTFKEQLQKFIVIMNWQASLNTAKDLASYMIYMSTDEGKTFDKGRSVEGKANTYQIANLEGGKNYTFKVTSKDKAGNESVGVVQSIRLPQTGVGASVLILGSVYGAHRFLKRRKEKAMQG